MHGYNFHVIKAGTIRCTVLDGIVKPIPAYTKEALQSLFAKERDGRILLDVDSSI